MNERHNNTGGYALALQCIEEERAARKAARRAAWGKANREHEAEYHKNWREANREHVVEYAKNYREANREREVARSALNVAERGWEAVVKCGSGGATARAERAERRR